MGRIEMVVDSIEVHQATGMITAQTGLDAEASLARLRGAAVRTGRSVSELAGEVLSRRYRFSADGEDADSEGPSVARR